MEAILYSSRLLSIPPSSLSSLAKQPTQQRRTSSLFITKQKKPLASNYRLRIRALNTAVTIAVNSSAHGGDISVLIPVSAVLLFMYWIANFVVPDIVQKDLQEKDSGAGEEPGQQINTFDSRNDEENSTSEPRQKLKKADLKKMLRPRRKIPEAER
ncbi:uncharacterized protein A4U43_C03F11710 [Asparagus officinalis]|uniref:Uncharacterized protein n=1 Tax=Asparagus officinalis TaxID=4686 RepID=A0A5P1FA18_ASPOF|nr:uncharacterized protein LOC109833488 [Asparagus officinalis]ONK74944.1 uncharacterized protein A4U43_C03F11710 [Asparagus officinalis]